MPCEYLTSGSIILGFLFILLAFGRAIVERNTPPLTSRPIRTFDPSAWAELLKAVVEFIKVAPGWTVIFAAGLILLALPGFVC